MLMRKYASGAFVTSIEQVGMDRILHIGLDSSEHGKLTLILEIMGKHSNLILVNSEGKDTRRGEARGVLDQPLPPGPAGPGLHPPPGEPKIDIRQVDATACELAFAPKHGLPLSWAKGGGEGVHRFASPLVPEQWLMNTFSGFGPFLADEIIARSGGEPDPRAR